MFGKALKIGRLLPERGTRVQQNLIDHVHSLGHIVYCKFNTLTALY